MRLKTILSAAGAVGIAGALALGAAVPANAASAADNQRLEGAFTTQYVSSGYAAIPTPTEAGRMRAVSGPGSATTVIVPGKNATGPVVDKRTGMCAEVTDQRDGSTDYMVNWEACDGAANQQFTLKPLTTYYGVRGWGLYDASGAVMQPQPGNNHVGMSKLYNSTYGAVIVGIDSFTPVEDAPIAMMTADVTSKDDAAKTAVIGGTGEPGAKIELSGPWGTAETVVKEDGTWSKEIGGLTTGVNPVTVTQKVEGADDQTKLVNVTMDAAKLIGDVVSTDADAKTAEVGGTGEPGAELEVTGPDGESQTVIVDKDGNWSVTVPNLEEGVNPITVKDPATGEQLDLEATLLPSPIVDPAIAGGAGIALIAALGTALLVRRRTTVKQ